MQRAYCLFYIIFVESIAALRAEFGRILGVFRLPAALVTTVNGLVGRLLCTAFRAEFTLVHMTAGTNPALGCTTLRAELAGIHSTAFAGPSIGRSSRCSLLLLTHLE